MSKYGSRFLAFTRFTERLDPLYLLDRKLCSVGARLRPFWCWLILWLDLGADLKVSIGNFVADIVRFGRWRNTLQDQGPINHLSFLVHDDELLRRLGNRDIALPHLLGRSLELALVHHDNGVLAIIKQGLIFGLENLACIRVLIDLIEFSHQVILVIYCHLMSIHSGKYEGAINDGFVVLFFDLLLEIYQLLLYFGVDIPLFGQGSASIGWSIAIGQRSFLLVRLSKLLLDLLLDVVQVTFQEMLVLAHDELSHLIQLHFFLRLSLVGAVRIVKQMARQLVEF
jgi:hypothetical protein